MQRPAVFFDRDNTLIVSDGYLGDPAGVVLVPGAADAIARARRLGFAVVTVSNQSGVARGLFDESAVYAVNRRMDELLLGQNPAAVIDRHEFCPDHPQAKIEAYRRDTDLRKPGAGMLRRAAEALNLDLSRSWLIGDAPRDIAAGKAAGCRTILFKDAGLPASPAAEAEGPAADFTVGSLAEAMDVVEGKLPAAASPAPEAANPALLRLADTADRILAEIKKHPPADPADFSLPKLLGGLVQVVVLAVLFFAYLSHEQTTTFQSLLLVAVTLQTLVIALLLMGRR